MNSTKSPLPTAAHRLTSVTFNGKEMVCYDYDGYGDLTAVYGSDGKKLRGFAYRKDHTVVTNALGRTAGIPIFTPAKKATSP